MQSHALRLAARPLVARRGAATKSTVHTIGRVLQKPRFVENAKLAERGAKSMLVKVGVEDPLMPKNEQGYYPTATQTLSMIVSSQAQEDFWNTVGPGSIVNAVAQFGATSVQAAKDPQYPPEVILRCQSLDVVVLKGEAGATA